MKNGGELGELADLEQQACEWIRSLQREHGETATPLPEKMREHLARFFPTATVEQVRVPRMPILCGPLPRVREGSRLPVGQSGAAVFYGVEQEVE
jgi:hypothetical protein